MNLETLIKVRKYDFETHKEYEAEMTLQQIVDDPVGVHFVDIGVGFLNTIRAEQGKELLDERMIAR